MKANSYQSVSTSARWPVLGEECWLALVEPVETMHTGDVVIGRMRSIEEQLEGVPASGHAAGCIPTS